MQTNLQLYTERVNTTINRFWHIPEETRRGRYLDIGCGTGTGVVAASGLGASLSVGIDIDLGAFAHEFKIEEFPLLCAHYGAAIRTSLLIEADIFQTKFAPASFDYCSMLDTIEHVPDPSRFIAYAYDCLAPGGYLLIDCGALYYSPIGHHLFSYLPFEEYPWVHLWRDFDELYASKEIDPWTEKYFKELNKVTHDEIVRAMREVGFEITHEHRGIKDEKKAAMFEAVRHRIRPEYLDDPRLFEDWIVAVGRKR